MADRKDIGDGAVDVTVVIPTHKRPMTLGAAIASVRSQRDVRIEILVVNGIVDDAETDAVVARFEGVRYVKDADCLSCSAKRLLGLRAARAPYIHFLDDDDRLTDDLFFRKAVDILAADETISFVAGDWTKRHERENGAPAEITHHQFPDAGRLNGLDYFCQFQIGKTKPQSTCTTVFRVKALTEGPEFEEVNDSSIYLKALLWGDSFHLRGEVAEYRVWKQSITGGGEGNDLRLKIETMIQKEVFLEEAVRRTDRALGWWSETFKMNFSYFENSVRDRYELVVMAAWGVAHAHGSADMAAYCLNRLAALAPAGFGRLATWARHPNLMALLKEALVRTMPDDGSPYEPYYGDLVRELDRRSEVKPRPAGGEPVLSVVVPVYNAGQYLRECLDSVFAQDVDLEVICVDDNSTDGSVGIVREYIGRGFPVRLICNSDNRHAGPCRNAGIEAARGEFIHFLDADDIVVDGAYAALCEKARRLNVDVLRCSAYLFDDDAREVYENDYCSNGRIRPERFDRPFRFLDGEVNEAAGCDVAPWAGLVRRSFVLESGIRFNDLMCVNDRSFYVASLVRSKSVAFVRDFVIFYRRNNGKSLIGRRVDYFDCQFASYAIIERIVASVPEEIRRRVLNIQLGDCLNWMRRFRETDKWRRIVPDLTRFVEHVDSTLWAESQSSDNRTREAFRRLLASEGKGFSGCRDGKIKVLLVRADVSLPKGGNLFVLELARGLRSRGVQVEFGFDNFMRRCHDYQVVHFEWPEACFGWRREKITHADVLAVRNQIRYARSLGVRICYTRHNQGAHYSELPNLDDLYRVIETECDTVIHMGGFSVREYREKYGDLPVCHQVVPHHLYPCIDRSITRAEARSRLGIGEREKVLLAFGAFRAEEEELLAVDGYRRALEKLPGLRLLAPRLPGKYGFGSGECVATDDLPAYFAAADVVMIPRLKILNSGNLPMAYYFGKVVVGPDVGNVGEILSATGNATFSSAEPEAVGDAIVSAFALAETGLGARNREYADREWGLERVVDLTVDAYRAPEDGPDRSAKGAPAGVILSQSGPTEVPPYEAARAIRLCSFRRVQNFGDRLSVRLVESLSGRETDVVESLPEANVSAVGTLFRGDSSPADGCLYGGSNDAARPVRKMLVWGTGCRNDILPEGPVARFYDLDIYALRGRLTEEVLRKAGYLADGVSPVLGDPGLLYPELLPDWKRIEKRYDVAVVPHYYDQDAGRRLVEDLRAQGLAARFVDVSEADPCDVLRGIAECRHVLSSSLHGLIVADAMGIPNRRVVFGDIRSDKRRLNALPDFKYADYYSAFGMESSSPLQIPDSGECPGLALEEATACVPAELVAACQDRLREAFGRMLPALLDLEEQPVRDRVLLSGNADDGTGPRLLSALTSLPVEPVAGAEDVEPWERKTLAFGAGLGAVDRRTVVWGRGALSENDVPDAMPVAVRAVRGPLTREKFLAAGVQCPEIYGDPLSLLPLVYRPAHTGKHRIGFALHQHDWDSPAAKLLRLQHPGMLFVNVRDDVDGRELAERICSCELLVSSALPATVIADAYGVPNVAARFSDLASGRWYQFRDYFLGVGRGWSEPLDFRREADLPLVDEAARRYRPVSFDRRRLLDAAPFPVELREIPPPAAKPFVSVIIPMYNVSGCIGRCLDSVLTAFVRYDGPGEVICVDDGSTDGSHEAAESLTCGFAGLGVELKVLSRENGGGGRARNTGLAAARGEYVCFCDADDLVDPEIFARLVQVALETDAELAVCGKSRVTEDGGCISKVSIHPLLKAVMKPGRDWFEPADAADILFNAVGYEPWGKLFRRSLIDRLGLRFQETRRTNDMYFSCTAMAHASRIGVAAVPLYVYCRTERSVTRNDELAMCFCEALAAVRDRLVADGSYERFKSAYSAMARNSFRYNLLSIGSAEMFSRLYPEIRSRLLALVPEASPTGPIVDEKTAACFELTRSADTPLEFLHRFCGVLLASRKKAPVTEDDTKKPQPARPKKDDACRAALKKVRQELAASQKRRGELWHELEERRQAMKAMKAEFAASQKRRGELWHELEERRQAMKALKAELAASQKRRGELWHELEERRQAMKAMKAELAALRKTGGGR